MERISKIYYKGKTILYFNYQGFDGDTEDEYMKTIEAAAAFLIKQGKNQLTITDVRNTFATTPVFNKFKEISKVTKLYRRKGAVVGISGVKAVFLKAVNLFSNSNFLAFDNLEDAKEWLVKD